jgi:hypothetical protein
MMRTFAAENFSDIRDLIRLYQRTSGWGETAYLRFLSVYLDEKTTMQNLSGGGKDPGQNRSEKQNSN